MFFFRSCKKLLTLNLHALAATWPDTVQRCQWKLRNCSERRFDNDTWPTPPRNPPVTFFHAWNIFSFQMWNIILFLRWNIFIPGLEKTLNFIPHTYIPLVECFYSRQGIVPNRDKHLFADPMLIKK